MEQSDDLKFAEIMATIGAAFSKPLTDIQLDIYFDCLREYSIDDITYAAKWILKNRTITGTFPLVSEFVQAIEARGGTAGDKAELAWASLIWAIENIGHMESISFDDPTIHDVVFALGGWIKIATGGDPCSDDWHIKNLQWRKKDFVSLYKLLSKGNGDNLPYLVGLQEAENYGRYDEYVPKILHISGKPGQFKLERLVRNQIAHKFNDQENNIIMKITDKIGG